MIPIGTKVTNELGWTGRIVPRPAHWTWTCNGPDPVVYVHWKEREERGTPGGAVVSAQPHKLKILSE